MDTPTTLDLDAIAARAEAATPGPWEVREEKETGYDMPGDRPIWRGVFGPTGGLNTGEDYEMFSNEDATFIAASRTDVPALVAHIEALEQQAEDLLGSMTADKSVLHRRYRDLFTNYEATRQREAALETEIRDRADTEQSMAREMVADGERIAALEAMLRRIRNARDSTIYPAEFLSFMMTIETDLARLLSDTEPT